MKNIIEIKNLNFKYNDKNIINNLNLDIELGSFNTIIGNNDCGKSTLVKLITGLLNSNSNIIIDGLILNDYNIKDIRKKIGVVFENPDINILEPIVVDELTFTLENMDFDKNEIESRINNICKLLNIENLLYKNTNELSGGEKQLVSFATVLCYDPEILILDNAFTMLDSLTKDKLYKLLKKLNREKKITIINTTNDIDDSLYGDEIIVMDNGNIVLKEDKKLIFNNEKLFKKLKIDLPFMVELSNKIKYYNLLDGYILDMDKMVNKIWK